MAGLRQTLDSILSQWGHNVLLQRRKADGTFEMKLERHTVRHNYPAVRGLPQTAEDRDEGLVHTVDLLYYFRRDAHPREGDRIYEHDERYPEGQTTWLIDYSLPMRGKGGRVDYWICGVTRESPE